jgi:hypothetical protein
MDIILTVIGILGLGALLIAAWVFASAAKRYVTGEDLREEMEALQSDLSPYRHWVERERTDRRQRPPPNVFPITIKGTQIQHDRRRTNDRRQVA